MAIFNRFPFSNAHELNLDWILRQLKDLLRRVKRLEESGGGGGSGTGDYNELENKPQINGNTLVGNKTAAQLGLGTYSKPAGGIPAEDLAAGVIPSVPSASTSAPVMDGVGTPGTASAFARGDHQHPTDTSRAPAWIIETVGTDGVVSQALEPNKYYDFTGDLTRLIITLNGDVEAHYHFMFFADTAITLTMPNNLTMPDYFTVEAETTYEVDILKAYVVVQTWT